MKIRIEIDENLTEEEVVIRSSSLNDQVQRVQKALSEIARQEQRIVFFKEETEYYLMLSEILFFETDGKNIQAHSSDDIYKIKYRLYELEEMLPGYFMRVSKSTILNTRCIYAIIIGAAALLIISRLGILNIGISIGMMLLAVIFVASLIKSVMHRNIQGYCFHWLFCILFVTKRLELTCYHHLQYWLQRCSAV